MYPMGLILLQRGSFRRRSTVALHRMLGGCSHGSRALRRSPSFSLGALSLASLLLSQHFTSRETQTAWAAGPLSGMASLAGPSSRLPELSWQHGMAPCLSPASHRQSLGTSRGLLPPLANAGIFLMAQAGAGLQAGCEGAGTFPGLIWDESQMRNRESGTVTEHQPTRCPLGTNSVIHLPVPAARLRRPTFLFVECTLLCYKTKSGVVFPYHPG